GVKRSGGQVRQGALDRVGEDLLDVGVPAVVGLSLGELKGTVSEYRVVAVGGEQLALALHGSFRVEPADPPHDQPPIGAVVTVGGKGGVGRLGDLGIRD